MEEGSSDNRKEAYDSPTGQKGKRKTGEQWVEGERVGRLAAWRT